MDPWINGGEMGRKGKGDNDKEDGQRRIVEGAKN